MLVVVVVVVGDLHFLTESDANLPSLLFLGADENTFKAGPISNCKRYF